MWSRFGVRVFEVGQALPWGIAVAYAQSVAEDPTTPLGARLAGWSYAATMPELLMIASAGGKKVLPFDPDQIGSPQVSEEEAVAAQAELEDQVIFS